MGRKTYTTYELVEYKDQKAEEENKEPPKEYVTKEEFAEYQKATIASINKLKSIIKSINEMKFFNNAVLILEYNQKAELKVSPFNILFFKFYIFIIKSFNEYDI